MGTLKLEPEATRNRDASVTNTAATSPGSRSPRPGAAERVRHLRVTPTQLRLAALAALCLFFTISSPYFLTPINIFNVLVAASVVGILANAQTLLLVAGQVDVSVGSGAGFAAAALAVVARTNGIELGMLAGLGAALFIELINILGIIRFSVPSIIVTLATMVAFRGALKLVISGESVPVYNFDFLGQARLHVFGLDIPVAVLLLLAVSAFFYFLMHYTRYGQHMFAIGANPRAARLSGLKLERDIVIAFVLSGCAVALASYLLVSQVTVVDPTTGERLEFLALTGVMIGGASLYGGKGSVFGTQVAILILAVIDNGLVLLQVVSFWQEVLRGGLLLVAVVFDELGRRSKDVRMRI